MAAPSRGAAVARRRRRCYLRPAPGAIGGGRDAGATASSSGSRAAATTPPSRWFAPARASRSARPRLRGRRARTRCTPPSAASSPRSPPAPTPSASTPSPPPRSTRAGLGLADLDAVAVTAGPGLIGGVLAGVMFAKGLAAGRGLPLWGVNHLAGHALTPRLIEDVAFPYLMLLVSGGHCQFLAVEGPERFRRLGGTIDDAPGEAFDKVGEAPRPRPARRPRRRGRGRAAATPARFALPRPLLDRDGCDLSFSGLKTAVRRARDRLVDGAGRPHPRRPRRPLRRLPGRRRRDAGREDPPRAAPPSAPPSRRAAGARRRRRRRRQRARSAPRSPRPPRPRAPASSRRRWRSAPTTAR